MTGADVASVLFRWIEYAGLLGFVGVVVVRRLAGNPPVLGWARSDMRPYLAIALGGGAALLAVRTIGAGAFPPLLALRVAVEAIAVALCSSVGKGAVPAGLLAAVALALSGHAAQAEPPAPAMFVDALHVLSSGAWAGGIAALAFLRPPGGWRGEEGGALLDRFARVATIAFALTALTGVLRATEEVSSVSDLWTTPYGAVLAAKSAGVVAMAALSAIAWRRGLPLARTEAALAAAAAAATAILAAFPVPPAQA